MPTPYSPEDLAHLFDARTLTRGRSLVMLGTVELSLNDDTITGKVDDHRALRTTIFTPVLRARRMVFERSCSCGGESCPHLAATALAALEQLPAFRKAEQSNFLGTLAAPAAPQKAEPNQLVFNLSPGEPPYACFVSAMLVGEQSGKIEPVTPARISRDPRAGQGGRAVGRLLGGDEQRTAVPASKLGDVMQALVGSGQALWAPTGKRLVQGPSRVFNSAVPLPLPLKSAVLVGSSGTWYVDAGSGATGLAELTRPRIRVASTQPRARRKREPIVVTAAESAHAIVDRPVTPVLQMIKLQVPDDFGRLQSVQALALDFEYDSIMVQTQDERQFVRINDYGSPVFMRRDREAEAAAFEALREDGFVQMRVSEAGAEKGRRVMVFHGADADVRWHRFIALRVPVLQAQGWRSLIAAESGPRMADLTGDWDLRIKDVPVVDSDTGNFSLEFGIEIDGKREPLLPILSHIVENGGLEAANIVGDDLIASLSDGRLVKLPVARIRPLIEIMGDLIEAAGRLTESAMILPAAEAPTVLELEDLLATSWQNAADIAAYANRYRGEPDIAPVEIPPTFTTQLRPYQQHGVEWLQQLAGQGLNGFLADDMGLGKTAQTIAHLSVEDAAGRLDRPALIVVPTSLIANWTAELTKFLPHFKVMVLHGLDRHERRSQIDSVHAVITTYAVLVRDIEEMKELKWHIVVLDEAQAIKSPDAKATRAVCQLDTRFRLCLSGTPIENNLEELWSQFAFLMPGLFGSRRSFIKRFRTPIERKANEERRQQLVRRIKPFILRRTKSEVATELPPKHTIIRRVTLAPAQREMYETIRGTLYDKVRAEIAEHSLSGSRIVVLDALLKLRQACCDPRLVKLASAKQVDCSSKLDELLEMVTEMIREGRRILLFSQFTSMLDLIKPRLDDAEIPFVELRGDTRDRAEPVRAFQAEEVPLFLISLKAGGRGLNLTAADTVIHYDPWWNPAVEDQASDRAHRIGQTKPVFVYKLIAAETVEERIIELQRRKAELAMIAFNETREMAPLDFNDIDYLFGGAPGQTQAEPAEAVGD